MKNVPLSILLAVLVLSIPPASGEEGPPPTPAPQTQTAPAVPGTPPPVDLQERRPTVSPPSDEDIRAAVEEALARADSAEGGNCDLINADGEFENVRAFIAQAHIGVDDDADREFERAIGSLA